MCLCHEHLLFSVSEAVRGDMDFLTLFAIYVAVVLTCIVLVCKYSGQQQTPFSVLLNSVGKVRRISISTSIPQIDTARRCWPCNTKIVCSEKCSQFSSKVVAPFTPKWLQRFSQWTLHRVFHQRFAVKMFPEIKSLYIINPCLYMTFYYLIAFNFTIIIIT